MCNDKYCTCCGHCNLKRDMFADGREYTSHIQHCPKRPTQSTTTIEKRAPYQGEPGLEGPDEEQPY